MTTDTPVINIGHARMINNLVNDMISRTFSDRLGRSWYSETTGVSRRNIYESLGYIKQLTFNDFMARFKRGDISKRIVSAPVTTCWRTPPSIAAVDDDSGIDNPFNGSMAEIRKERRIYHYLKRADLISGIGRYAVIWLGINDGARNPSEEVTPAPPGAGSSGRKLLYMMPYTEANARIVAWDVDPQSPRNGLPEMYQITTSNFSQTGGQSINVHHSRIIHIAEDLTENDVYGTPRLEACFNRLQDLELVAGGSGEMFWRGAFPGFNFKVAPEADPSTIDTQDLKDQLEKYVHGLVRYLRLQGIDVQELRPQVVSPKDHMDAQLRLISAATGIPKRILEGSERGELSSDQDERAWLSQNEDRREQHVEPGIVRPFIDKLIDSGVVPKPDNGYNVTWQPLTSPSRKDKSEVAKNFAGAIASYVGALGADQVLPPEFFLRDVMGYNDERLAEIRLALEGLLGNETDEKTQ